MGVLAKNKKAYYDYEILETYDAGIVLNGQEVKSIKNGRVSIKGSYVRIRQEEAWLVGAVIPAYQLANAPDDYDQQRARKLLLRKKQIKYLLGKTKEGGLTLVPLKVYTKSGLIKIQIGLGRGKKKEDKRAKIRKREAERKMRRAIKRDR